MASPKIERLFVSGRYNGRNTVGFNKGISLHERFDGRPLRVWVGTVSGEENHVK
jgi:hypothetical protein